LLRLDLGLAYERAGRSSDARRQYLRATQLAPGQPQAWTSLGTLEARTKEAEAAERHLRLALRADPEHAAALFELGNLLRRQGDIDEARALLERYRALHQERAPRPLEDGGSEP
ncbi:MAG TPA: tetratricopeptide repeat protein, partial [Acidobacteriota bacterium]